MKDPVSFGYPTAILVPRNPFHVSAAVKFAAYQKCPIQAACGRHTTYCVVQGSLMVDLTTAMNYVRVDPETQLVTVGGGARIGEVDQACAPHFLFIPLGRIPSVGVAGQILHTGGRGYSERKYGLGIDYVVGATVVVGTGDIIKCSAEENSDLLWAIKGGNLFN
jgi:FAD/FMN-containing dehydrogenase